MMNLTKFGELDVRWIHIVFLIIITVPLLKPMGLPMVVTPEVKDYAGVIDELPPGSIVWIAPDYHAAAAAEVNAHVVSTFKRALERDLNVIIMTLYVEAPAIIEKLLPPIAESMGKTYGVDYVNLGYNPGEAVALRAMLRDIGSASGNVDHYGNSLDDLPLMKRVPKLDKDHVDLIVSIDIGGHLGSRAYMEYVTDPLGIPLLVACSAGMTMQNMPYYRSKQILGLLPGLAGSAQYEIWLQDPGIATAKMDAQSLGIVSFTILLLLGNIGYLASRSQGGRKS